ncbi:MAG: twin-arginine translocase TatA/TatE family subunit [Bdellovibrionales bacterium]|nr:twin-arginine translocase TatA/TatE family subunit [Bdellovibrionales bacterium]
MFNMGLQEMIVLGAIALLVIGPKQLPEVARVVGRMLNEFKRATGDLTSSIATVKNEAQGLADQTQSYMHKQRAEFEKKMREGLELDESENGHAQNGDDNFDDLDPEFRPSSDGHNDHAHEEDYGIVDEKRQQQAGVHQPESSADQANHDQSSNQSSDDNSSDGNKDS